MPSSCALSAHRIDKTSHAPARIATRRETTTGDNDILREHTQREAEYDGGGLGFEIVGAPGKPRETTLTVPADAAARPRFEVFGSEMQIAPFSVKSNVYWWYIQCFMRGLTKLSLPLRFWTEPPHPFFGSFESLQEPFVTFWSCHALI